MTAVVRNARGLVLVAVLLALVGVAAAARAAGGSGSFVGLLVDVAIRSVPTWLVAIGMALVVGLGGIDLAVGSVMALAATLAASAVTAGAGFVPALALALLVGAALGAASGTLIRQLGIQPLVATLVAMVALRGAAQLVSGGQILEVRDPTWLAFGAHVTLGMPVPLWLALVVLLAVAVLLGATRFGATVTLLGANPRAARLLGLGVTTGTILTYAASGALAALAGLVETAWNHAADADKCGLAIELDAILAVVIGGTPLRGGRVRLGATVLGVLVVEALATTLTIANVPRDAALCAKALLVLVLAAVVRGEAMRP